MHDLLGSNKLGKSKVLTPRVGVTGQHLDSNTFVFPPVTQAKAFQPYRCEQHRGLKEGTADKGTDLREKFNNPLFFVLFLQLAMLRELKSCLLKITN